MTELIHILSAEVLKLKRTLALRLALGMPLLLVLLALSGSVRPNAGPKPIEGMGNIILTLWAIIVLPFHAAYRLEGRYTGPGLYGVQDYCRNLSTWSPRKKTLQNCVT